MKCNECKYCYSIANTDESRQAICSYDSYSSVCIDNECRFTPKPLTCGDCSRLGNDDACFTRIATDLALTFAGSPCPGFIDKKQDELIRLIATWYLRGENVDEKIMEAKAYARDFVQGLKEGKKDESNA